MSVLNFSMINHHPMAVISNDQKLRIECENHSSGSDLRQDLLPYGLETSDFGSYGIYVECLILWRLDMRVCNKGSIDVVYLVITRQLSDNR